MGTRKIITYPDEVLRGKCQEITNLTAELDQLVKDMLQTMYQGPGIGLAAPQIGISQRLIVVDVSDECTSPITLINPVIAEKEGQVRSDEGCLSIPGYRDIVDRSAKVLVKGLDISGKEIEVEADGLLSRCLQHEIDHLDGVLFVDHLSRIKKEMFRRWVKRQEAEAEAAETAI